MLDKQFKLEAKIQNGSSFRQLKQKFWKFQGQFDLEDQGQGYQFSNHMRYFDDQ